MDWPGRLLIIGGKEDKKGDRQILRDFVGMAGGHEGVLSVITTATRDEEAAARLYMEVFTELGAHEVIALLVQDRVQASDPQVQRQVERSTGIFFTGGDQLRITSLLGGTPTHEAIKEVHRRGAVVGGTSAGASVMSATMIVEGPGDDSPRRADVRMSPGMGFFPDAVIDQHFAQRGRVNRLFTAVAQSPQILGIGIDEDTAIVVRPGEGFRVIGSQTVTVIDATGMSHSTASEAEPERALGMTDLRVHVLLSGYAFDLRRRRPLLPAGIHALDAGER